MAKIIYIRFFIFIVLSSFMMVAIAAHHTVSLNVGYKLVNFTGVVRKAISVNDTIPAPTLHFKQGDIVTINVSNHLDKETAIHWHGLLVPWQMDGVLGVAQQGIPVGAVFQYHFKLEQAGTYWYHAHAGLQEQQGLYGALIVDPPTPAKYHYTKDFAIVLSDWSNTNPEQILANLKKDGDYYAPRFPLQASLFKFIKDYRKASISEGQHLIADYKMMQQMRMGLYDISDVAYDSFLLNGRTKEHPWTASINLGDIVRLRFIAASASTIFRVKIPGSTMQVVQVQGNDVSPYLLDDFQIAPGETLDVLLRITKNQAHIIYAESMDTVGVALGALVTASNQSLNLSKIKPFSEPLPVTRDMTLAMTHDSGSSMASAMDMSKMDIDMSPAAMSMPTDVHAVGDELVDFKYEKPITLASKYQNLKAAVETNDPQKSIYKVINMALFGYMGSFIWMINGVPEYKAHAIVLKPNKRYRFVFTNPSMMHHPMHMHGHWFILRNGHGKHDPLLHTIDIAPGSTVTADVDTDASGQWFFHCHFLYHMVSGMSRVFQYSTLIEIIKGEALPQDIVQSSAYINRPIVKVDQMPIDSALIHHPMAHPLAFYKANFLEMGEDPFHHVQKLNFKGLYGSDFKKLELYINDAEVDNSRIQNADLDIFYWHRIYQFWAIKGGINYFYRPTTTPYWQPGLGIEGLMPYFIDTNIRAYYLNSSFKLDAEVSRDTQVTNNFFIRTGLRTIFASKTLLKEQMSSGLNQIRYLFRPYYRLMPGLNVFIEYEHEQDYGAFKAIQNYQNDAAVQDTITFGISTLF